MTTSRDIAAHRRSNPAPGLASSSAPSPAPLSKLRRPVDKTSPIHPAEADFFGYTFRDPSLLALALTHSSLAYENNPDAAHDTGADNEQLEFIGDAVLGLVVAEALFMRFPSLREGDLTRMRASLVNSRNLAQVAQRIDLGPRLRLGRGEEHSGGQRKPAILANALEAVIAAIYLDGGLSAASAFIHLHIIDPAQPSLSSVMDSSEPFSGAIGDYKSALQERLQAAGAGQPQYVLMDQSGPDHQKRFRVEVRMAPSASGAPPITLASAEGSTKKQAQQEAARLALLNLLAAPSAQPFPESNPTPAPPVTLSAQELNP